MMFALAFVVACGDKEDEKTPTPDQPVEPTPDDPTQPVEPTPEDPTKPVEPTPDDPTQPVEPTPDDPTQPVEPTPEQPVEPTDMHLYINGVKYENGATIEVVEFDEFKLEFEYEPVGEPVYEGVDASSSNEDVLRVDGEGNVVAVAPGIAYIEVASLYAEVYKTYYFNVTEKHFAPESITVSAAYNPVEVNEEVKLSAVVAPDRASQEVTWSSADETIAVVDPVTGVVTGKGIGKVVITAASTEVNTVVGTFEVEVIAEVPADKSVVYVGAAYTERGQKVTIDGKEFIVGKNAFADLTAAAKGVVEGGEVRIEAGSYDAPVSIIKGAKFVALGDVTINEVVRLENGLKGLEFNGIKFAGKGAILSYSSGDANAQQTTEVFEDIKVINCTFDQVGSPDDATFHIYGLAKDVVFEGNKFNFASYRGVRFENTLENLTFKNNEVVGKAGVLYDGLRGMGLVCGKIEVVDNVFDTCVQSHIQFANVGGKSTYTFEGNVFKNSANTAIDVRALAEGQDVTQVSIEFNIRFNQFLDSENSWGTIRLRAQGIPAEQFVTHINYNKFKGVNILSTDANEPYYVQQAGTTLDYNYNNGDYNYSDLGAPQPTWVHNALSAKDWYKDEASIDEIIASRQAPEAGKYPVWEDGAVEEPTPEEPTPEEPTPEFSLQAFADEMVALFNSPTEADKVETTQSNFTGSTHPNVKYVFDDAETLAKYKWFFEYALAEMAEAAAASNNSEHEYYTNTKEMLEKMVAGDVAAITGNYANGRTCFRQFIHRLINAENAEADAGNPAYNPVTVDFAANPEKVAAFLELYKANNGAVEEPEPELLEEVTVDPAGEVKTIAEALTKVKEGGKVIVKAGTYEEDLTVEKAVSIVADGEVVLVKGITLAANNVLIKGVKFTAGTALISSVALENITVEAVTVEAAALGSADGMFQFGAYVTGLVVKDCSFSMMTNRGIRFEVGGKDLEVTNCQFEGNGACYDHIRFQGPATGKVVVSGCSFKNSNQSFIYSHNITGAEVSFDIKNNKFDTAANVAIDIRTHNGAEIAEAKVVYNIVENYFTGVFSWGTIRLRPIGLTEGNVQANINYNKFVGISLSDDPNHPTDNTYYVQTAGGEPGYNYINADYNYSDLGAYKESWVHNCASHEGWFESEEALDQALQNLKVENISVADAIALGLTLSHQQKTEESYKMTVVIASLVQTKYGNVNVYDEEYDSTILVYGLNKDGKIYQDLAEKPVVGDKITIVGKVSNFNGTPQIADAELLSFEKGVMEVTVDPAGEVKTIAEALAKVNERGTVVVKAGTYEEDLTVEKGVSIVADGEVVLTKGITLAASNVLIKGVKFTAGTALISSVALENITVEAVTVEAAALGSADGMFQFGAYVTGLVVKDCSFSMMTNRGIRFEVGGKDLEVTNCQFEGNGACYDHIRFQGPATGKVVVSGCSFKNSNQSFIYSHNINGAEVSFDIVNNTFENAKNTCIDIRTHNGAEIAEAKVSYNITRNSFTGVYSLADYWGVIRLRPIGLTEGNVSATINYNVFKGYDMLGAGGAYDYYVQTAGGAVSYNYINADYNYSDLGAYQDAFVHNCASHEGWFESEEALKAALNAAAETTVNYVLAEAGFENAADFTTVTVGEVAIAASQNGGSNPPKYYNSGTNLRVYTNNTLTFKANAGYAVKSVKITFTSTYEVNEECTLTNCAYEVVDGAYVFTPVDGASEFGFANTKAKGQIRITAIEITYGAA